MGRSRFKFQEHYYPYFLTSTIVDEVPLFSDPEIAKIVLDSLEFIQKQFEVTLYAYVIMENHIHVIAEGKNLSESMRKMKSYTAKQIIISLEKRNRYILLKRLRFAKKAHKKESEYQVWQEGVHPKQIDSLKKMTNYIEYIHFNPVKAGYVDFPEHWRYTSARAYLKEKGLIPITLFSV